MRLAMIGRRAYPASAKTSGALTECSASEFGNEMGAMRRNRTWTGGNGTKVWLRGSECGEHGQELVGHGRLAGGDGLCLDSNLARSLIAANLVRNSVAEGEGSDLTGCIAGEVESTRTREGLDAILTEIVLAANNASHQIPLVTGQVH